MSGFTEWIRQLIRQWYPRGIISPESEFEPTPGSTACEVPGLLLQWLGPQHFEGALPWGGGPRITKQWLSVLVPVLSDGPQQEQSLILWPLSLANHKISMVSLSHNVSWNPSNDPKHDSVLILSGGDFKGQLKKLRALKNSLWGVLPQEHIADSVSKKLLVSEK